MQQPQRADAAAHEPASTVVETHGASAEAEPALPRILIIGDSISIGYHDALVQRLRGVAHVCRPDVNCSSTRTGLENLSSWLTEHGPEPWDLIQFNHGLHGTQRARARIPASPIDIRQCVQSPTVTTQSVRTLCCHQVMESAANCSSLRNQLSWITCLRPPPPPPPPPFNDRTAARQQLTTDD
jgi:hypothetical protein